MATLAAPTPGQLLAVALAVGTGLGVLPAAVAAEPSAHVVVVGIAGLRWEDAGPRRTPALWHLAGQSATAAMSIRTVSPATCPVDGWLTLGAGRRAAAPVPEPPEPPEPACAPMPRPRVTAPGAARIEEMAAYRSFNAEKSYAADLGLLSATLRASGRCVSAVGPGAAVALAGADGALAHYSETASPEALSRCPVTTVDLGAVDAVPATAARDAGRAAQVAAVDRRLGALLPLLPPGATLLLAGVADSDAQPHLAVALARGPAPGGGMFTAGWINTRSTRRTALVQLTDLTPTVLAAAGATVPDAAIGSIWTPAGGRPANLALAVEEMVDLDTAAQVVRRMVPPFFTLLIASQLLLYGLAAVALRREWGGSSRRLRVLRVARRTALVFAAGPVATFLANLVPWWRTGAPLPALVAAVVAAVAVVTAVALVGPWRRALLGPFGVMAAATALVLALDVMSGSRLQLSSLMGYQPLVAGRFYGFGNVAFALFMTGWLLAAAAAAEALCARGRQGRALGLVALSGLAAALVDGWPAWGSDFGGVIAIVPGFLLLGMLVAGLRVTVARLVLSMAAGGLAIAVIATLDWLRPAPERAHLGRFVQQVLDGEALPVVTRKLQANWDILTSSALGLLVPFGFAFVVLVLMRPLRWRAAALDRAYARAPRLRSGLVALVIALFVGFAVNDSGIAIPAVALTVAIPLVLAASITALERDEADGPEPGSAPARERVGTA